ncbi:MAG: hypothetical protein ACR2QB_10400 [Gammaproteobacteria bacterium]
MTPPNDPLRDRVQFVLNGRPSFFNDPAVDKLLAMNMALLSEICVLRDRLDAHERLAASLELFGPGDVDQFVPDDEANAARTKIREASVDRVMKGLTEEIVRLRQT